MTEDPTLRELEARVRTSLARRTLDPGPAAQKRIARRVGVAGQHGLRRGLTLAAIVLVVILSSLVLFGSLITARPSPGVPAPASFIRGESSAGGGHGHRHLCVSEPALPAHAGLGQSSLAHVEILQGMVAIVVS